MTLVLLFDTQADAETAQKEIFLCDLHAIADVHGGNILKDGEEVAFADLTDAEKASLVIYGYRESTGERMLAEGNVTAYAAPRERTDTGQWWIPKPDAQDFRNNVSVSAEQRLAAISTAYTEAEYSPDWNPTEGEA